MVNLVAKASDEEGKCPWCGTDTTVRVGRHASELDRCAKCGFPFPTPDEPEEDKPAKRW